MGKQPKDQTLRKLADSRAAELVTKPGRFPEINRPGALLRRVSKGQAEESARIIAATFLLQETLWADVASSALLALERIFGIEGARSRIQAVKKGRVGSSRHGARIDLTRAHDMLRTLLEFMSDSAAEAMVAQLILNEKGELHANVSDNHLPDKRREIPGEKSTALWAKLASDDPIVRLRR